LQWEGDYGNDIHHNKGGSNVNTDGKITLYGDVWKAYNYSYPTTVDTHITFHFELIKKAEGHAICIEDDLEADTYGGSQKRCIALGGTQFGIWGNEHVKKIGTSLNEGDNYSGFIRIGDFFPDIGTTVAYIAFVQDNDASPLEGVSTFWNIKLSENPPVSSIFQIHNQHSFTNYILNKHHIISRIHLGGTFLVHQ